MKIGDVAGTFQLDPLSLVGQEEYNGISEPSWLRDIFKENVDPEECSVEWEKVEEKKENSSSIDNRFSLPARILEEGVSILGCWPKEIGEVLQGEEVETEYLESLGRLVERKFKEESFKGLVAPASEEIVLSILQAVRNTHLKQLRRAGNRGEKGVKKESYKNLHAFVVKFDTSLMRRNDIVVIYPSLFEQMGKGNIRRALLRRFEKKQTMKKFLGRITLFSECTLWISPLSFSQFHSISKVVRYALCFPKQCHKLASVA